LPAPATWPASTPLASLGLLPQLDWAGGLQAAWRPGEAGARARLARTLAVVLATYPEARDRPDQEGTARLSPHLHWGEISPRRIWDAVARHVTAADDPRIARGAEALLRQLGWREFAHHLLWHFPHTAAAPLRGEFAALPWRDDADGLRAWRNGRTGYPLVDAGLRELWATGWMHNRVRMVAASFLVKHLLLPWQAGAGWFWDTLVDADLANNTFGWQWTAGCGADAAPFFRIFNPVLQGRKFDPDGAYVRRWVPELADLPAAYLHEPWRAPAAVLASVGVRLGVTYPHPLVEHAAARQRALAALAACRGRSA
jgi:deoxyribodipyrimidine photo-lyase